MKIVLIVEGKTERAFKDALNRFLQDKLSQDKLPRLHFKPQGGLLPTDNDLKKLVEELSYDYDAVIALTDVYTGTDLYTDASDAKAKMRRWVGKNEQFFPHVAQYDFEAWLLPYWGTVKKVAKTNRNGPSGLPETINHNKPPSKHLAEVFETTVKHGGRSYNKPRDAARILKDNDLTIAANACPELKAFLNTILTLCDGEPLP